MSTTSYLNPMEVIRPMAEGVIMLAAVSAMAGSFGSMGMAAGISSFSDPRLELKDLETRISRLSYVLENQREALKGTRQHKANLMHEYGLSVLPSVVEMKKYPKLRATDYYLRKAEGNVDRMEVKMLNLRKKRKELQMRLGIIPHEEEEVRRVYPATKKFQPPLERRY